MSYKAFIEELEVRADVKNPQKTFIRGKASINTNKKDFQGTKFTPNFRRSLQRQLVNKDVYVDTQHFDALTDNIKVRLEKIRQAMLQKGLPTTDIDGALEFAKKREYPSGKVTQASLDENGDVDVEILLNHYLPNFETIKGMVDDKFLNGLSIVFDQPKTFNKYDKDGKSIYIDDARISGLDIVSTPACSGHTISEVFVRMAVDNDMEDLKMENEMKEKLEALEKEKKTLEEKNKKLEEEVNSTKEKVDKIIQSQKEKEEAEKKAKEDADEKEKSDKVATLETNLAEMKQQLDAALSKNKSGTSVVAGIDNPNSPSPTELQKKVEDELKEKDLSELLKLQIEGNKQ